MGIRMGREGPMSVERSSLPAGPDHKDRKNTFLKKQLTLSQTCGILIEVQKCTKQKRGIVQW